MFTPSLTEQLIIRLTDGWTYCGEDVRRKKKYDSTNLTTCDVASVFEAWLNAFSRLCGCFTVMTASANEASACVLWSVGLSAGLH